MSLIMFLGAPTMLLPPQHNGRFAPHHPRAMVSRSAPEEPEVFVLLEVCAEGSLTSTTAQGILQCPHPQQDHRGDVLCWPPVPVTGTPRALLHTELTRAFGSSFVLPSSMPTD